MEDLEGLECMKISDKKMATTIGKLVQKALMRKIIINWRFKHDSITLKYNTQKL